ncbi:MAG: hypothetical protein AAFN18_08655 [Cyanobacteria bacterium J06554_6]
MTKKRIADLLKEEVAKSEESGAAAAAEPKPAPKRTTRKPSTRKASSATKGQTRSRRKPAAEEKPAAEATVEVKATELAGELSTEAADISVAAEILKNRISELENQLAAANQKIADLQADVATHQDRVYELKDSLDAAQQDAQKKDADWEKVKAELETAKDTIRQLTAEPSSPEVPQPESSQPKSSKSQLAAKAPPSEPKPARKIMGADLATDRRTLSARRRSTGSKAIPDYAILRDGQQNSMLSDDDIGWVD